MPKSAPKMESWQVFHFARKHLSSSMLYTLFGKKNARAIDYWIENPTTTAKPEGAYEPTKGVKNLLDLLDDKGNCDTVRDTIAYLAADTSCATDSDPEIIEPLPTIGEEILADFRAVSKLQGAIEDGWDIISVDEFKRLAITEIERTVAKYRKDQQ